MHPSRHIALPPKQCTIQASIRLASMQVEVRDYDWGTPSHVTEWLPQDVISMSLSAQPAGSQVQLDRLHVPYTNVGYVNYFPGGQTLRGHSSGGLQRLLVCRVASEEIERVLERRVEWSAPQLLAGLDVRDPEIRHGLARMAREAMRPGYASPVLLEALATTILVDLARYLDVQQGEDTRGCRLAAWQLRRISERIQASDRGIPRLTELAELCNISVRHLVRAFKASTGETVHRSLMAQQIAKARALLVDTDRPLKTIASDLGFKHPASFSVAFQRACGETPRSFRNRMRG